MKETKGKRGKELEKERLKAMQELENMGMNPFKYRYDKDISIKELRERYEQLDERGFPETKFKIAGRIMGLRRMGKMTFADLQDEESNIQLIFKKDMLNNYTILKYFDIGDFIGTEGTLFRTHAGEFSLLVSKFTLLTKSLLPLPEKYHGIKDQEIKYRKRYLHLIVDKEARAVFKTRSKIISELRKILEEKGFIEFETPILQPLYGGANARPFITHLNAKNTDMYLRISDELYLKRLIIGGYEKVFEIGKDFRNESIDTTHNPEFTMMEAYWAYADYNDMMKLTEELVSQIVFNITGTHTVFYQGKKINFKVPWKRLTMAQAIKKHAGIDVKKMKDSQLNEFLIQNKLQIEGGFNRGLAIAEIFDKLVQEKIIQPTFVTDYPKETTALCKLHRKDKNLIERFEPVVAGLEIGNAYSELNNPLLQKKFFLEEEKREKEGVQDTQKLDEDFIEALKYGMPPTGGLGIGIDRLVMLLCNKNSIRDVILFPLVK